MQATGNGEPMRCVANLLRITRGECVYDRVKGMDPELIDMNSDVSVPLLETEAKWLIKTYEPRVNLNSINVRDILSEEGVFGLHVDATVTE